MQIRQIQQWLNRLWFVSMILSKHRQDSLLTCYFINHATSFSRQLALVGLITVFMLLGDNFVFMKIAYAQNHNGSQTTWTQLPALDSYTSPAVSGHTDGRIYVAAVSHSGHIYYTSTDSPGDWDAWQSVGLEHDCPGSFCEADPAFHVNSFTPPVFARDGDTLYLFALGQDHNLYMTFKEGSNDEASWQGAMWQQLTVDGKVRGRFSVALTRPSDFGGNFDIHIIYASENNTVRYMQFDSFGNQVLFTEQWNNAREGTIGTDGKNRLLAVIRTNDRRLLIEEKVRSQESGWNIPWGQIASRLADGSQGEFFDISNVVFFGGIYHVAYTVKSFVHTPDGPMYLHSLTHTQIRPGQPDKNYQRIITKYAPYDGSHPQTALVVYRNKLVAAYKNHLGRVYYAYWDNADSTTPWIGNENVAGGTTSHRPAIAAFDKRTGSDGLTNEDYLQANFGNDLFAAVHGYNTNRLSFINFSRAFFAQRLDQIGLATGWCTDYIGKIGNCPDNNNLPLITEAPVFSEVGYGTIVLPNWMMSQIFHRTMSSVGKPNEPYYTWIHTIPITPYIGPNLNIGYADDYMRWWEEMGHRLSGSLGICDDGHCQSSINLMSDFISDDAIKDASVLFGKQLNPDCFPNNPDDTCPTTRVQGFTGHGSNYDVATRQHSWIYVLYYYLSNSDQLRQWIQEDLTNGDSLLQQKYDWIKQYIFKGMEFTKSVKPLIYGTVSSGMSWALDTYRSPYSYALPPGKTIEDIVGIGITGSNDHVYAWYKDGTVSSGTSWDLDAYRSPYPYVLPPGKTPSDIVGMGIAGSNDHVYVWYQDGTVSSGTSWNLNTYRSPYPYILPSGKAPADIVGMSIAGSNDHVYVWYQDGTISSGTSWDLSAYRPLYRYVLPTGKMPEDIVGMGSAGTNDHVYVWYRIAQ